MNFPPRCGGAIPNGSKRAAKKESNRWAHDAPEDGAARFGCKAVRAAVKTATDGDGGRGRTPGRTLDRSFPAHGGRGPQPGPGHVAVSPGGRVHRASFPSFGAVSRCHPFPGYPRRAGDRLRRVYFDGVPAAARSVLVRPGRTARGFPYLLCAGGALCRCLTPRGARTSPLECPVCCAGHRVRRGFCGRAALLVIGGQRAFSPRGPGR